MVLVWAGVWVLMLVGSGVVASLIKQWFPDGRIKRLLYRRWG